MRRMADYDGNSNVSRIAGDGKSRVGPLETNLLRTDLVSPDRRFHPFTLFVSNERALLSVERYRVHGIRNWDTRTLRLTSLGLWICDSFDVRHFAERLIVLFVVT